jgi:NTE family protein
MAATPDLTAAAAAAGSSGLIPDAEPVPVTLALQDGGAVGAFGWGVLERLLDEPRLRIAVVSGASAGR